MDHPNAKKPTGSFKNYPNGSKFIYDHYNEYIAGFASGLIRIGIGYPIETLKVRTQTMYKNTDIFQNIKTMVKTDGIRGFYRGSIGLFAGSSIITSMEFGSYGLAQKYLENNTNWNGLSSHFLGGAFAGGFQAPLTIPVEHIRNIMQTTNKDSIYKNSYDAYKKIFLAHGLKGIYRGSILTLFRDVPGTGSYFATYHTSLNMLNSRLTHIGKADKENKISETLVSRDKQRILKTLIPGIAGIFAGLGFWLPVYPLDVIKSKIQTDNFEKPTYKSYLDCTKKTWTNEGIRGFYKGFNVCLLRSIPVHFFMFICYEKTLSYLNNDKKY